MEQCFWSIFDNKNSDQQQMSAEKIYFNEQETMKPPEICFTHLPAGQFAENETNEVNFREIPSHVLSKVCMYFTYKVRYTNSSTEIPEFPIAPEIALELLMAANFLDC